MIFALYESSGYMKLFMKFLSQKKMLLENRLFTKWDSLMAFLEINVVDVLLLEAEEKIQDLPYSKNIRHIILLSDGKHLREHDDIPVIFKYQSAENVLQEILAILAEEEEEEVILGATGKKQIHFFSIAAPFGRPLSSSQGVAHVLSKITKKEPRMLFLYLISFSGEIQEISEGYKADHTAGMSELIFYLKQQKKNLSLKLHSLISYQKNMDVILPVTDFRDLCSLDSDSLQRFIDMIERETDYDIVIFYMHALHPYMLSLMEKSEGIFLPMPMDEWEQRQKISWEKFLQREGFQHIYQHSEYISSEVTH